MPRAPLPVIEARVARIRFPHGFTFFLIWIRTYGFPPYTFFLAVLFLLTILTANPRSK